MPDSGWFTSPLLVLGVLALAAAASVRLFAMRIAPNVLRVSTPGAVIDSLGPFALALPLIAAGWRTESNIAATGWIVIGAPITIAVLAVGSALCVALLRVPTTTLSAGPLAVGPLAALAWSAVGGMLLLLGAANDLTVWIGQCSFALGAVVLWINTPELPRHEPDAVDAQASSGLTMILCLSVIQSAAMLLIPASHLPLAAAIVIAHAAMIVMLCAGLASPAAAIRMGSWTATYGVLLGLGTISLRHLLPQTLVFVGGDRPRPPLKVAYGFGEFAFEAMILLLLGVSALALDRITARHLRIALGTGLILAAAMITGWRLASM